jgi:hypothetical protein
VTNCLAILQDYLHTTVIGFFLPYAIVQVPGTMDGEIALLKNRRMPGFKRTLSQMAYDSPENMTRIALAGSGGLAQIFAFHINETSHPFVILSRTVSFR